MTSGNTNDQSSKRTEIQIRLAGGIGISLINGVPEELVFATFSPIEVSGACHLILRSVGNTIIYTGLYSFAETIDYF